MAGGQIAPLFNTADSRILQQQVKYENFEKFSWPYKAKINNNQSWGNSAAPGIWRTGLKIPLV
jgi:hypothetical protein